MQTGVKISAGVHGAVLAWVLVGGTIFRPAPPDPAPMAVTLVSAPVFDAMRAPAPEAPQDAPRAAPAAQPEPPPTAPATAPAPPARPDPTETAIALPDPAPVPPAAEPAPATSPLAVAPPPPDAAIAPAPADRVAPVARPAPPEAMPRAADERPALAPAPDAPPVTQAPAPAAAPQAAAPQIVTEAEIAPGRSPRPPGRPPAVAAPAPAPEADTAPTPDSGMSMADALAAAASASAPPAPAAQLSEFETRNLIAQIGDAWNLVSQSAAADGVVVTLLVSFTRDGRVVESSIRRVGASPGSPAAVEKAYGDAIRAILRASERGLDLPAEKYEAWRELELVFDPERMRGL
jgi:hypothetical protein